MATAVVDSRRAHRARRRVAGERARAGVVGSAVAAVGHACAHTPPWPTSTQTPRCRTSPRGDVAVGGAVAEGKSGARPRRCKSRCRARNPQPGARVTDLGRRVAGRAELLAGDGDAEDRVDTVVAGAGAVGVRAHVSAQNGVCPGTQVFPEPHCGSSPAVHWSIVQ